MKNNLLIPLIIGAVVIAGGSFFAGMHFGAGSGRQMRAGAFANGGPGGAGRGGAGGTFAAGFAGGRGGAGGLFTTGEVISSDDTSLTVKLRDGGSKNVFFASSTTIGKMAEGSKTDLTPGTNVMVTGSANQDGSITANSIQIRPAMPAMPPKEPVTDQAKTQ